jgi:subtilisin family serine protease
LSNSLAAQIERAREAEILFVAAAGNSGRNTDVAPVSPAGEEVANIIAVGASTDIDTLPAFSNYGPSSVDLAAPGVNILSTIRGASYGYGTGTSMATPHVAGAAALVLSVCGQSTAALKETLLSTVDRVSGLTGVVGSGGRLNVERAIRSCIESPAPSATASFVSEDTTTGGNWRSRYGRDGYAMNDTAAAYPPYTQFMSSGAFSYVWAPSTQDPRALELPDGADRVASTWYGDAFRFDLNLVDGVSHRVAVYMVDWDADSRSQTVEVIDRASGAVLDVRTVQSFINGQFLVWNVSGEVAFRITRTSGVNAVISGIFFDPVGSAGSQ